MAKKSDLINNIAKKINYLTPDDITKATDIITDSISTQLTLGAKLEIRGFGSLSTRERKYSGQDKRYKTIYYRMAKNIPTDLK